MRFLLLLLPSLAFADARLAVHAGGGAEAGTIMKDAEPTLAAELGMSAYYMPHGSRWGYGFMLERVERREVNIEILEELKLDVMIAVVGKSRGRMTFGFGLRELGVPGDERTPPSTVWGIDVMRLCGDYPIVRVGHIGLEAYFSWTFGWYSGEVYNPRYGDMAYTKRDYSGLTNTYIFGLATSMTWD